MSFGQEHAERYVANGNHFMVVAPKGGASAHPGWYGNLRAEPPAGVQVEDGVFDAVARDATARQREALWATMVEERPAHDEDETETDREIPVVVLARG